MTDTKSSDDVIAVSHEMPPSASKTPSPEKEIVLANQKKKKPPPTLGKSLVGLCKIAAKHLPLVVGVYAMGYFNFSIAWILGIVGITAATDQWRKERNYRMSTARASAFYSDKDVIMARVSDLPSWVSAKSLFIFFLLKISCDKFWWHTSSCAYIFIFLNVGVNVLASCWALMWYQYTTILSVVYILALFQLTVYTRQHLPYPESISIFTFHFSVCVCLVL